MADYRRMVWQHRANIIAEIVRVILFLLMLDEINWALRYHFPWWDDIMMPVTMLLWWVTSFVIDHTRMYREALK